MTQHDISKHLKRRVDIYLHDRLEQSRSFMDESEVDLLPLLHKDLYGELKYAIVFPRIKIYTNLSRIFRDKECKAVTRSIATKAAEVLHVLKDEEVFTIHEVARGMYFLNSGLFDFTSADGTTFEITPDVRNVPRTALWSIGSQNSRFRNIGCTKTGSMHAAGLSWSSSLAVRCSSASKASPT
jgi:hypothetical protein